MKTKTFYFGHYWQMYGTNSIEVPADFTVEQAIEYVNEHWADIKLPSGEYIHDSDEPNFCESECGFDKDNKDDEGDKEDEQNAKI